MTKRKASKSRSNGAAVATKRARARGADPREEICRRLIEGESLRTICSTDGVPDKATVLRWLAAEPEFRVQYALAKQLQAEIMGEENKEIADTPQIGEKRITKPDGTVEIVEGDMVEHRRLRISTRQWLMSKYAPKRYGDSTLLKHADPDGRPLSDMSDTEKAVRLASILQAHFGKESK